MDRESVLQNVLEIEAKHSLLEFPTGFGKCKNAIELAHKNLPKSILIVVFKLVHEQTWIDEFNKWGFQQYLPMVKFVTYISLHKHMGKSYDVVIMDEIHHLTEKSAEYVPNITSKQWILLSGTVSFFKKDLLHSVFSDLYVYKIYLSEAIDNGILPNPMIYLMPLKLDNTLRVLRTEKNTKGTKKVTVLYKDRWEHMKDKTKHLILICTEQEYYEDLESQINWSKMTFMRSGNQGMKNRWLQLCSRRLEFLSSRKNPFLLELLNYLEGERTLTMCGTIKQTEALCANPIHNKNKESGAILHNFNEGNIDHISSCNMLNEGVNLENCRFGIYANLNGSDTLIRQRLGRLLRHKDPILIIPYYIGTRDEELKDEMLLKYSPEIIKTVLTIEEIELTKT